MGQAKDEAGNIWQTDAAGNAIALLVPAPSQGATGIGLDPAKARAEQREEERLSLARDNATRQAALDRIQLEKAQIDIDRLKTGGSGKPMRQGDADHLEEQINAYSYLKNAARSFDDKFAGNTVTGELENKAQRLLGTGTPGQSDWWANFRTADNLIRNKLFGASLTQGEKEAYAQTTINPSMTPDIIRQNLARREQIAREILSRRVQRLHTVYNPSEVEAQLGEFKDELLGTTGQADEPTDEKTVATGDTKTVVERGPVEKKLAAMLASGTPSANIRAYAKANNFPSGKVESVLAWRAMNPGYKGAYDVSTQRVRPTTPFNRLAASPAATVAAQAANAATGGFGDEIAGAAQSFVTGEPLDQTIAALDLAKQMQAGANPKSALAGNILGGLGGMTLGGAGLKALGVGKAGWLAANPIKAAALGDAAYGGIYGAGENNDDRLTGAAIGAPVGLAGSLVGQGGAKALGLGMRGVVNPAVDRLRAAGIPLTAGEVLGGGWKKAQDAMTSMPFVGGMVARRAEEGRRGFNQAAFNEAGETIGTPINAVGQDALTALDAAKSRAYASALNPVTVNLSDPNFVNDLNMIGAKIAGLPNADAQKAAVEAISYHIGNNAEAGTADMAGRGFQEAYRGLARAPTERGAQPYAHEFGQAMRGTQDALAGVLERQAPGAYEGFLKANSANRHLNILADAVNSARGQIADGDPLFTPAQLAAAATNNTKKYGGKLAAALGDRPFNHLAKDAQEIMGQKVPDSGTATRAAIGLGLTSLGSGGVGYGVGGGEGAGVGTIAPAAALTLLGTRRGQAALTAALLKRGAAFRRAGSKVSQNPQLGGDILAAAGIPLLEGSLSGR